MMVLAVLLALVFVLWAPALSSTDTSTLPRAAAHDARQPGKWTMLSDTREPWGYGFQSATYDPGRNRIITMLPNDDGRVCDFDIATNRWSCATDTTSGQTAGKAAHNCSSAYENVNDRVWFSSCAPQPVPGAYAWSPANKRFIRYDTRWPPCSVDAAMGFDAARKAIYCVGGYNNQDERVSELGVAKVPDSVSSWRIIWTPSATAIGPKLNTSSWIRLTYTRGGWDPTAKTMWVIDDAMDLWRFDPGVVGWTRHVTSGAAKPPTVTVMALDDASRTVVGWAGLDEQERPVRQTWLLDLTTYAWRPGPSGPTGTPTAGTVLATSGYTAGPGGRAHFFMGVQGMKVWRWDAAKEAAVSQLYASAEPPARSDIVAQAGSAAPAAPSMPSHPALGSERFPRKVFVPVACEKTIDLSPWPCGGGAKHQRWAADGKGAVWTGFGDTNPSRHTGNASQNQGYRLDVATGRWTRWNAACRPAGQIMPAFPDELAWVYDKRGAFWLLPGVLQGTDGATCNSGRETGATLYKSGLFRYDVAKDQWQRIEGVAGTDALWGHFDNKTKQLMYWGTGGCGSRFHRINVDTLQRTHQELCLSTRPYPGSPVGTFENYADGRAHAWAWDEEGRTAYFVAHHGLFERSNPSGRRIHAWSLNVDTGKVERLPDPPNTDPKGNVTPDAQDIIWDSTNRRVLYPYTANHCGVIEAMYTYDPVQRAWESHPVTLSAPVPGGAVRANSAVYDPANNVMVLGGSVACDDWGVPNQPPMTHYFLWRG